MAVARSSGRGSRTLTPGSDAAPAHAPCNGAKRDFLVAASHLRRWRARLDQSDLADLAEALVAAQGLAGHGATNHG